MPVRKSTTANKAVTKTPKTIPVSWIKKYASENGPEIKEIIGYMLSEYTKEQNRRSA